MSVLGRTLYAGRFLELVNRVCLVQTGNKLLFFSIQACFDYRQCFLFIFFVFQKIDHLTSRVCVILVSYLSDSMATSNTGGHTSTKTADAASSGSWRACNFEIFGTVQGVFFRKYTQQQATKLHLVGWVKNTEADTVQGHMEGRKSDINTMKNWLQKTGSPKSKITKAEFSNEISITQLSGTTFSVKK